MQLSEHKNRINQLAVWLLPSLLELSLYVFISLLTVFTSNLDVVQKVLYASGDFNPIRAAIDSISVLLERLVGERIAGSLSLAIFWGLVGLLVNAIWWVGSNFSTELNNDLVFSNYVHPKNYDPKTPLREFISRTVFRTAIFIILIFYLNFVVREALPHISTHYGQLISNWQTHKSLSGLIFGVLAQCLLLHIFVVLVRLLLLRKQIFSA